MTNQNNDEKTPSSRSNRKGRNEPLSETVEMQAYVLDLATANASAFRAYTLPVERTSLMGTKGLVNPPIDLVTLARFFDESTWHRNSVSVKARDVVGHDWTLRKEGQEEGSEESGDDKAQRLLLETFFQTGAVDGFTEFTVKTSEEATPVEGADKLPGSGEPFPIDSTLAEVMTRLLIDYDTVGNAYLAVIRPERLLDEPQFYAHVQASKIRIHRDRLRYRWLQGRTIHWFKRFGAPVDVHVKTGEFAPFGSLPQSDRAVELIHLANYTPTDQFYGLPEVTPAIGAMVLELLSRDFNIKFFDNNAVPQYAVVIEGFTGDVPDSVKNAIRDFFNASKGDPHRTLVLNVPANDKDQQPTAIKFEKLAVDIKDGHFSTLRADSRDEVLVAHAVPPYRLGMAITGTLGATNIREANEIYKFQEVDTRRIMLEEAISSQIIHKGFEAEGWFLEFGQFDISDEQREVDRWTKLVDGGLATPNEGRVNTGQEAATEKPEMDEFYYKGKPWGDIAQGDTFALFREREDMVAASRNGASKTPVEPVAS